MFTANYVISFKCIIDDNKNSLIDDKVSSKNYYYQFQSIINENYKIISTKKVSILRMMLHMTHNIKTRYWIINYVCVLSFCFPSQPLLFTPNSGHYTPQSLWSSLKSLLFMKKNSLIMNPWAPYRLSVVWGGGCCARNAHCTKIVGGVEPNGWGCAGVQKTIFPQKMFCAKPNTKPDSHYGSQVRKGLGTQAPRSNREYNLATAMAI